MDSFVLYTAVGEGIAASIKCISVTYIVVVYVWITLISVVHLGKQDAKVSYCSVTKVIE